MWDDLSPLCENHQRKHEASLSNLSFTWCIIIMTNTIKAYEQLTCVELKSWKVLFTPASMQEVSHLLSDKTKDFVIIDWVWFNRFEVKEFYPYTPNSIDLFILSKDKDTQKKLREILRERESKGLKTNGTAHLWSIYESRFLTENNQNDWN